MGFRGAGEWKFPLIENWGGGGQDGGVEDSSTWHSCLSEAYLRHSSSSPPEGCLIRCFGLPRLLSLEGGTDLWYTE